MNPWKLRLARAFDRSGLSRGLLATQRVLLSPYLRAVNYHGIARADADAFDAQLEFYARHFEPIGIEQLEAFLGGRWRPGRPGLLLTFDDGLRSHAEVAAPLLERRGWPGWFCVPAGLPEAPCDDHRAFREKHALSYDENEYEDRRGVLDWDDLRRLDRHHVIVCHTHSHRRLRADLSDAERRHEIVEAKRLLEQHVEQPVRAFAWVGGEEESYSAEAAATLREAGFDFVLMTNTAPIRPWTDPHHLQRTNIEAHDPPEVVRFQLSGAMDLLYWPKRRRVDRMTAA